MKNILLILSVLFLMVSCTKERVPQPLSSTKTVDTVNRKIVHYWNFNGGSLLIPSITVGGATINVSGTYDAATPGSTLNARNNDDTGSALRVRNPSTFMVLNIPTVGFKKPIVSFAVMRTSNGAQENRITYSVDGINFTDKGMIPNVITVTPDWQLYSFDFSNVDSTNQNPHFAVKISFNIGNDNTSGNDRFDNITVDAMPDGNPPPPPDTSTDSLMHYWAFNANTADTILFKQPSFTIGGASLTYAGNYMDTVQSGCDINLRMGEVVGNALRLRNPAGPFTLNLPTGGYKNIKLKFAVMRTSNGAQQNLVSYSLNGVDYITDGLTVFSNNVDLNFGLVIYDFSTIMDANNNPNFKVRINFGTGGTNTSGNDRFDNISLEGKKIN